MGSGNSVLNEKKVYPITPQVNNKNYYMQLILRRVGITYGDFIKASLKTSNKVLNRENSIYSHLIYSYLCKEVSNYSEFTAIKCSVSDFPIFAEKLGLLSTFKIFTRYNSEPNHLIGFETTHLCIEDVKQIEDIKKLEGSIPSQSNKCEKIELDCSMCVNLDYDIGVNSSILQTNTLSETVQETPHVPQQNPHYNDNDSDADTFVSRLKTIKIKDCDDSYIPNNLGQIEDEQDFLNKRNIKTHSKRKNSDIRVYRAYYNTERTLFMYCPERFVSGDSSNVWFVGQDSEIIEAFYKFYIACEFKKIKWGVCHV